MALFDEMAFERKLKQDSDFRFKMEMQRNKLLGRWAAEKLGIEGEAIDTYIQEVIASDFEEAGDADVVRKLLGDFAGKSIEIDEQAIREKLGSFEHDAAEKLMAGD